MKNHIYQIRGEALLTYSQVGVLLNLPINTLYSMVSKGTIPYVRISPRSVRFEREAIQKWLEEKRAK